jgi:RES domain-containing protein
VKARHGGRFNPLGTPALYTALRPETAWLEAQQGFAFKGAAADALFL